MCSTKVDATSSMSTATPWNDEGILNLAGMSEVIKTKAHLCRLDTTQQIPDGPKSVRKLIGFLTNSSWIAEEVNKTCIGDHDHVRSEGKNRTTQAHLYPTELCRSMCKGLRKQKQVDAMGIFTIGHIKEDSGGWPEAMKEPEKLHVDEDWIQAWDDVTGKSLNLEMARESRSEEIEYFKNMNIYTKVPIEERIRQTGKKPIGGRWVDSNKQDESNLKYRFRLLAKEIKRSTIPGLHVATPPLERLRMTISSALSEDVAEDPNEDPKSINGG